MISVADAGVDPGAVVVHFHNTSVTCREGGGTEGDVRGKERRAVQGETDDRGQRGTQMICVSAEGNRGERRVTEGNRGEHREQR